jgi:outer membrane immunogenic protein
MIRTILVSALLAGTAGAAWAADVIEAPPVAPDVVVEETQVYSWDGAYLGIFGGANWLRSSLDDGGTLDRKGTKTGGLVGGFAGWNTQLDNNIVFGIEGDLKYDWNDKKYSGVETGTDWGGSARARLGYSFDNALIYAAGGWTGANAKVDSPTTGKKEKMINGWTVGAGVDYKFTESMFARAEYRYNDYGKENFGGTKVDFNQHQALIGVGFKF